MEFTTTDAAMVAVRSVTPEMFSRSEDVVLAEYRIILDDFICSNATFAIANRASITIRAPSESVFDFKFDSPFFDYRFPSLSSTRRVFFFGKQNYLKP